MHRIPVLILPDTGTGTEYLKRPDTGYPAGFRLNIQVSCKITKKPDAIKKMCLITFELLMVMSSLSNCPDIRRVIRRFSVSGTRYLAKYPTIKSGIRPDNGYQKGRIIWPDIRYIPSNNS
jgi:hypothetical protein